MKNIIIIVLFLYTSVSFAQIINVPADQPTIQAGIDVANNGDTVLVDEGTYFENILIYNKAITLASNFLLDNDTTHISKTIIDGSQPINTDEGSTVTIHMSVDTTVLCGFTITGGYGHKNGYARMGGGVGVVISNAIICHNKIINNLITDATVPDYFDGAEGGGIYISPIYRENLKVIIRKNYISNNIVKSEWSGGAGISIAQRVVNFNYLVEDNIINNNTNENTINWKAMGGGIYIDFYIPSEGERIIRNNIIKNNQAISSKGMIYSFGGGMYIVMIETKSDGSVDNDPGPFIYNNIISGNHSGYFGGGVSIWRFYSLGQVAEGPLTSAGHYTPRPSFINNTIVNNTALEGAGFFIMNHKPFLMNNIIWNDYPDTAKWGEIFLGNVPYWSYWVEDNNYSGAEMFHNNVQGSSSGNNGEGNINSDPIFSPPDSLYRLSSDSPCIGSGTDSVEIEGIWYHSPHADFFGNIRPHPIDSFVDIGAIESEFLIVGIEEKLEDVPNTFSLSQNYPNPFNPNTTIKYQIPQNIKRETSNVETFIRLNVFDILGQEVATLVNQKQKPGNYEVKWEAVNQPSGVYFYKIQAEDFIETKKMVLLR